MPSRHPRRFRGSLLPLLGPLLLCCFLPYIFEAESLCFARNGGRKDEHKQDDVSANLWAMRFGMSFVVLALCAFLWYRALKESRRLKRPYELRDLDTCEVEDPQGELTRAVTWLQETVVLPIDKRLPGRPFEYDLQYFPCIPTVLIIGNHSSGKSTFINRLMGTRVQETGVAPTDDGFTVLQRHADSEQFEDGPTLMGCAENKAFRDLQRFGRSFLGHFRRKRVVLPEGTQMPFGLQLIDTPGMIDLPGNNQATNKARGYNFVDVVRWWAKRADLILLLFDPDKPGTTGETLEVLTKSLAGLDHKFLVVLNKVDQLDNNVDFARAYGTLGWALSKVIPQKDIPMVWTMFNERDAGPRPRSEELQLEDFEQNRRAVVREVLRAKVRHWDNVVTSFEECLRQIEMVATVSASVRRSVSHRCQVAWLGLSAALATPWLASAWALGPGGLSWPGPRSALVGSGVCYMLVCIVACRLLQEYLGQFVRLQLSRPGLDATFEKAYHSAFIHTDGEDLRTRWETVRPRIDALLKAVPSPTRLPVIASWELARIDEILDQDIWYLRQLAKRLRPPEPGLTGAAVKETAHPSLKPAGAVPGLAGAAVKETAYPSLKPAGAVPGLTGAAVKETAPPPPIGTLPVKKHAQIRVAEPDVPPVGQTSLAGETLKREAAASNSESPLGSVNSGTPFDSSTSGKLFDSVKPRKAFDSVSASPPVDSEKATTPFDTVKSFDRAEPYPPSSSAEEPDVQFDNSLEERQKRQEARREARRSGLRRSLLDD